MTSSDNTIRVRFSRHDEESSAILMRSESTVEQKMTSLKTNADASEQNDSVENAVEACESFENADVYFKNKDSSLRNTQGSTSALAAESISMHGSDSASNTEELPSNDSVIISTCRVVKQEKKIVLETPLPSMVTVLPIELPSFTDGFTLDILIKFCQDVLQRYRKIPFLRFRLFFIAFLIGSYFILPGFLSGIITGIYISMLIFLYVCVADLPDPRKQIIRYEDRILQEISKEAAREENSRNIYKGWMNILNEHYNPHSFHVNTIQTVLVRLDGNMLRISRPERAMMKHTFHTDPTLTEPEPRMLSQSIYDLTNAKVRLRPRRLARRRWFSRKYPICIRLASAENDKFNYSSGRDSTTKLNRKQRERSSTRSNNSNSKMEDDGGSSSGLGADREDSASLGSMWHENHTIAANMPEMGREADGYMSDTSCSPSETEAEEYARHSVSDFKSNYDRASFNGRNRYHLNSVTKQKSTRTIYLFARSAREKERWFNKLRKACSKYMLENSHPDPNSVAPKRRISLPSMECLTEKLSHEYFLYILHNIQFMKHLDTIIPNPSGRNVEAINGTVLMDLGRYKWQTPETESSQEFIVIVNLVVSRLFYDFCRDEYWVKAVKNKIQNKLASMHLPYFIEVLELSNLDIGTAIPKILKVYSGVVDEWGIWTDFEIKYEGLIKLTLETKVNLLKMKEHNDSLDSPIRNLGSVPFSTSALRSTPGRYSDEEIPESPETSPDEEFGSRLKLNDYGNNRKKTGKKILNLVDKIAASKYFQNASELKPIRKLMEEVSSTRLILNVEVTALEGIMTINIPPPPSDRLWYGFRRPPRMSVKAVPQVGDRTVIFSTLSDWIEGKIRLLLEKNLVMPNLDDIVVPVLSGNELLQGPLNK
ncbi:testis-expressed protein 2 [Ditylenchus destructor]|nr:testis-expressed protein 2 [Ditylenchus destructor]